MSSQSEEIRKILMKEQAQPGRKTEDFVLPVVFTIIEEFDSDATKVDKNGRRIVKGKIVYAGKTFTEDNPVSCNFEHRFVEEPGVTLQQSQLSYTVGTGADEHVYTCDMTLTVANYIKDANDDNWTGVSILPHLNISSIDSLPLTTDVPGDTGSIRKYAYVGGDLKFSVSGLAIAGGDMEFYYLEPPTGGGHDGKPAGSIEPTTPKNVVATPGAEDNGIYTLVTWDAAFNTSKYEVDLAQETTTNTRPIEADFEKPPAPQFVAQPRCLFYSLTANAYYWVRIRSIGFADKRSDWTYLRFQEKRSEADYANGKPYAPAGLTATALNPFRIYLTWPKSTTPGVKQYRVYRSDSGSTSPDTFVAISRSDNPTTDLFYTDTPPYADIFYFYRVKAIGAFGAEGEYSSIAFASTTGITNLMVEANELMNRLSLGGVLEGHISTGAITANKIFAGTMNTYRANFISRYRDTNISFWSNQPYGGPVYGTYGTVTLARASYATAGSDSVSWGEQVYNLTYVSGNLIYPRSDAINTVSTYVYVSYFADANGEPTGITPIFTSEMYPTGVNDIVLGAVVIEPPSAKNNNLGTLTWVKALQTGTVINGANILTGSISAQAITTGILQSKAGNSKFNLDAGTFQLGDPDNTAFGLKWDGNTLAVKGNITANAISAGGTIGSNVSITAPVISGGLITAPTIWGGNIQATDASSGTISGFKYMSKPYGQRVQIDSYVFANVDFYDASGSIVGYVRSEAGGLKLFGNPTVYMDNGCTFRGWSGPHWDLSPFGIFGQDYYLTVDTTGNLKFNKNGTIYTVNLTLG